MVGHEKFGELRLSMFLDSTEIDMLENWEFEDHLWVGEAFGFSEWLRLEQEPDVLRSLSLDFSELPEAVIHMVLHTIELPLQPKMNLTQICSVLGEPVRAFGLLGDRTTYDFIVDQNYSYKVSCTVLNDGGLVYLVVMTR